MNRLYLRIACLLLIFFTSSVSVFAQASVLTAGGSAIETVGSFSYSIGQVFVNQAGDSQYVIEGNQQPFEISLLTEFENLMISEWKPKVFPNPVKDLLSVDLNCPDWNRIKIQLFNVHGQLVTGVHVGDMLTGINMSVYECGIYYLTVQKESGEQRTFKIIKNQ